MANKVISNNSDFLFLYEATQCNPNGDPDQENKPRMDYDTDTNLVSDTRIKRYMRDYMKHVKNVDVFVDMEGNTKVSPSTRLKNIIIKMMGNEQEMSKVLGEGAFKTTFDKIKKECVTPDKIFEYMENKSKKKDKETASKEESESKGKKKDSVSKEELAALNYHILAHVVKEQFIDIRWFGSAFAIAGFTKSYIGPIQLNWGYSLHKVDLLENSIVTIMSDDSSTFGKDYRVHYSLLAFSGTINRYAAQTSGLTEDDVEAFRDAIWQSIPSMPTRSKTNQYPKLYVEVVYHQANNGALGDLRQYLQSDKENKTIRNFSGVQLDTTPLEVKLKEGFEQGIIKKVIVQSAAGRKEFEQANQVTIKI